MEQYISKAVVVAEIKRRLSLLENGTGDSEVMKRVEGVIKGYKSILSFLDTIEVKEMNLEKEAECFVQTEEFVESKESPILVVAKHFFELGLKAQKGE